MHDVATAVASVAAQLHDSWRATRLLPDGSFEPRWKDGNTVDIASTEFADLPEHWQVENLAAAQHAITSVLETNDLEAASAAVHVAWLERNGAWAPLEQQLPYPELSELDKEKDRAVVRLAAAAVAITLS